MLLALLMVNILLSVIMFVLAFYFIYKNRKLVSDNKDGIKSLDDDLQLQINEIITRLEKIEVTSDENDRILNYKQYQMEQMH